MVGETVEKIQLYSLVVWDECGVYQKTTFYVRILRADPTDGPVLCNSSSITARANWNNAGCKRHPTIYGQLNQGAR